MKATHVDGRGNFWPVNFALLVYNWRCHPSLSLSPILFSVIAMVAMVMIIWLLGIYRHG
jgi:hypothetical protein